MTSPRRAAPKATRVSLRALRPLLPYAFVHRGRIARRSSRSLVASAATLSVPVAVRRMVDFGFSDGNAGLIHVYFRALIGVVAVLALASGARYYLVMTLGERVVADLRGDLFAHLTRLDPTFFDAEKTGEIISRLSADTTQLKATFGSSASVALRNLFMFVGAIAMMVVTSPNSRPMCWPPSRSSSCRSMRPAAPCASAPAARRTRSPRRPPSRPKASAAVRVMQSFVAETFTAGRFRDAADGAYEAARDNDRGPRVRHRAALFLAFGSVVVVLWLGAQDVIADRMTGGELSQFVLFAVFGAGALGQFSEVWSEVSQAAGAAGAHRRDSRGQAAHRRARCAARAAEARPRRARFPTVAFAYPGANDEPVLARCELPRRARAKWSPSSGPRGGQVDAVPARERFYDPSAARSRSTASTSRRSIPPTLRAEIALVPQDAFIFGAKRRRQHRLWGAGRHPAGGRGGGEAGGRRRLHLRSAARLRHAPGRARGDALGRRAPAPRDRPRNPEECAGAAAGRGDIGARRRERNAGPGRARNTDAGPHHTRHRASASQPSSTPTVFS